jgi:hypothetical protein
MRQSLNLACLTGHTQEALMPGKARGGRGRIGWPRGIRSGLSAFGRGWIDHVRTAVRRRRRDLANDRDDLQAGRGDPARGREQAAAGKGAERHQHQGRSRREQKARRDGPGDGRGRFRPGAARAPRRTTAAAIVDGPGVASGDPGETGAGPGLIFCRHGASHGDDVVDRDADHAAQVEGRQLAHGRQCPHLAAGARPAGSDPRFRSHRRAASCRTERRTKAVLGATEVLRNWDRVLTLVHGGSSSRPDTGL